MNVIIGPSILTLKTDAEEDQRDHIDKTLDSAEILLSIIYDILDFSKIEAGYHQHRDLRVPT